MQLIKKKKQRGAGIISLIIIIGVITIFFAVAVNLLTNRDKNPVNTLTYYKLIKIKEAITGINDYMQNRSRNSFGFVGDMGIMPANLFALIEQGSSPDFSVQHNVCFGWRGPYLEAQRAGTDYLALVDEWGNNFRYQDSDTDPDTWSKELRSSGKDGIFDNNDDIFIIISDEEVRTYIKGSFLDRLKNPVSETGLTVYYPDGSSTIASVKLTPAVSTVFNSSTDTVTTVRKIPAGIRFFESETHLIRKLASINGGPFSVTDLIGMQSTASSVLFENSFRNPGDLNNPNAGSPINVTAGSWYFDNQGNLVSNYGRVSFGSINWKNYRIEADVTLPSGNGYGIYYRSDGLSNVTGYIFQFDPGLYSGNGLRLVVRKVYRGNENYFPYSERFAANVPFSRNQFRNTFGTHYYNNSHHISITVNDDRHIIKVDGIKVTDPSDPSNTMDFHDAEPLFPCGGLCGMSGFRIWNRRALFHHIRIYEIPPMKNSEIAWWSFEEGDGSRIFGSGFLIDSHENNGTISRCTRINDGIYGSALRFNGNNSEATVPDASDLNPDREYSMEVWARPDDSSQKGNLFQKGVWNFGHAIYQEEATYWWQSDPGWKGLSRISGHTDPVYVEWGEGRPVSGRWYHLVMTYDGEYLNMYVTFVLDPSDSDFNDYNSSASWIENFLNSSGEYKRCVQIFTRTHAPGTPVVNNSDIYIGFDQGGSYGRGYFFDGTIDEVYYYKKALSNSVIIEQFKKYRDNL